APPRHQPSRPAHKQTADDKTDFEHGISLYRSSCSNASRGSGVFKSPQLHLLIMVSDQVRSSSERPHPSWLGGALRAFGRSSSPSPPVRGGPTRWCLLPRRPHWCCRTAVLKALAAERAQELVERSYAVQAAHADLARARTLMREIDEKLQHRPDLDTLVGEAEA